MSDIEEYFGVKAELNKDKPQRVADTLRIVADKIEDAPEDRRYDLQLQTREWVVEVEKESTKSDLSELNYNELKKMAAERGLDVGINPEKHTLINQLNADIS